MKRKKNLVLLCHCVLNCNSKVNGLALYEGAQEELVRYLVENGYGMIQLPCPEMTLYGVKRWGHVKEQFDTPCFRKHSREIFSPILDQIQDYLKNGYNIKALVGIDGSPSCGINKTCSSIKWGGEVGAEYGLEDKIKDLKFTDDSGAFIEEINKMMIEKGIGIQLISIGECSPKTTVNEIIKLLESED